MVPSKLPNYTKTDSPTFSGEMRPVPILGFYTGKALRIPSQTLSSQFCSLE